MDFSALPAYPGRSKSVDLTRFRKNADPQLRGRRLGSLVNAFLLVAVCGSLCYLLWVVLTINFQQRPQQPDFGSAPANYDKVQEGMSIGEVEALLGPPSGDPRDHPELEGLTFSLFRGGLSEWRIWQPDDGAGQWLGVYFGYDDRRVRMKIEGEGKTFLRMSRLE